MLRIRSFEEGDELRLHPVFHSSVHTHAVADHSPEQLFAWSPAVVDAAFEARWIERMRRIRPFVVEAQVAEGWEIAAYGDIQRDGYIDHFFVAGGHGGRGVGTMLMRHLIGTARERGIGVLTSDVSMTAQRFFAGFGFVVVATQTVVARGVEFTNTRMRRVLESSSR